MFCANTVAVVVPSPASSLALEATSFTICAPIFSNLSSSSISLATDTPSLVMIGEPNDLSRITLRPLGPKVTRTAFAKMLTPLSILLRASSPKRTSFAAILKIPLNALKLNKKVRFRLFGDHAKDVVFFGDDIFLAFDFFSAFYVSTKDHFVADFHI